jgi:hypothetical protein
MRKRLPNGETKAFQPMALALGALHLDAGLCVKDMVKAVPGSSKDTPDYYVLTRFKNGSYWAKKDPCIVDSTLKTLITDATCALMNVHRQHADERVVGNVWPHGVLNNLGQHLYEADFLRRVDGQDSFHLFTFKCGTQFNSATGRLQTACAVPGTSQHSGYDYPEAEIEEIKERLANEGLNLEEVLRRAKAFEDGLSGEFDGYPDDVVADLDRIAEVEGMEQLKTLADIFDTRPGAEENPHPPRGWHEAILRIGKVPAGALFSAGFEVSIFDGGADAAGDNGKGVIAAATNDIGGMNACDLDGEALTHAPPDPNNPKAYALMWRGKRLYNTAEIE